MDERYLRFPRWIEESGLPEQLTAELGPEAWWVFRRLVEEDLQENLFPDWVDLDAERLAPRCGVERERFLELFHGLAARELIRVRDLGSSKPILQYRIGQPLPVPLSLEELLDRMRASHLPDRPVMHRYWEESEGETKYERILRLYEATCGLKISGRIVEDLVELAESHPYRRLEQSFEAARQEGVTSLGWIKKHLKGLKAHERVQETWGRPGGLELPEGYTVPSRENRGDDD